MYKKTINLLVPTLLLFIPFNTVAFESDVTVNDAARKGDVPLVEKLLIQGYKPDKPNRLGFVALSGAAGKCTDNHLKILRLLIQYGANIDRKGGDGTAAISNASYWGCKDNVKFLIKSGADVNTVKNNNWTPLMSASSNGSIEIVKLLLEAGADAKYGYINKPFYGIKPKKKTTTVLDIAKSNKHEGVVTLLKKYINK
jgi:ankyrin repeat protein